MTGFYIFTRYLTFPGVLVRGLWEHLICRACGVPVEDARLLRRNELCGHLEHELMPKSRGAFALCFVPALFNGLLALFLATGPLLGLFAFDMRALLPKIVYIVAYWFAFSLYVNSYPLIEDAINMREKVYHEGTLLQKIVYAPGFVFCYIGAFLERWGVTFLLALAGLIALIVIA